MLTPLTAALCSCRCINPALGKRPAPLQHGQAEAFSTAQPLQHRALWVCWRERSRFNHPEMLRDALAGHADREQNGTRAEQGSVAVPPGTGAVRMNPAAGWGWRDQAGRGQGRDRCSLCLPWHVASEPGETWHDLQPFSAPIALPGLVPWAFSTFSHPCSPSCSPSMSSRLLTSTLQSYGFLLLSCLHPAPKQQKKWGRKWGFWGL